MSMPNLINIKIYMICLHITENSLIKLLLLTFNSSEKGLYLINLTHFIIS